MTAAKKSLAIDVVKGVLILVVIAGHNEGMMQHALWARHLFYFFNTQCFFLLSSLLDTKPFSTQLVRDRACRYLIPYVFFMALAWLAFLVMRGGVKPFPSTLLQLGEALLTGSEPAIHRAVGIRYLWFLPALFSLVVIKAVAIRWPVGGKVLLLAACALIGGAAFVPAAAIAWLPFNAATGLFFFGLGEAFRRVWQALSRLPDWLFGAGAVVVTAVLAAVIVSVPLGWVAGSGIRSYDITRWPTWTAAIVFPGAILLALLGTSSRLPLQATLALCGNYSLPLYLIHMLLYRVLTRCWFGRRFDDLATVGANLPAGLAIFALTVVGSLALSIMIWKLDRVRRLIFPRDWSEFSTAFSHASV